MVEYCGTRAGIPLVFLPRPAGFFFSLRLSPFSIPSLPFFLSASVPLLPPSFPVFFTPFAVSRTAAGSLRYSFSLASYVRNEPQLIHHNRFTCMSAGNFHRVLLSLSLPYFLSFVNVASMSRCCRFPVAKHPDLRGASRRVPAFRRHDPRDGTSIERGLFHRCRSARSLKAAESSQSG